MPSRHHGLPVATPLLAPIVAICRDWPLLACHGPQLYHCLALHPPLFACLHVPLMHACTCGLCESASLLVMVPYDSPVTLAVVGFVPIHG
jgi:hypothetical protein